jgi:protease-4
MGSIYASTVAAAAADRKQSPDALRQTLEAGPYLADQAFKLHLIDRVGEVREAEQELLKKAGSGAEFVDLDDYSRSRRRTPQTGPTIAVIEAEGAIVTGKDGVRNPFTGGSNIYSDDLSDAFYDAIKARDVKAIVAQPTTLTGSIGVFGGKFAVGPALARFGVDIRHLGVGSSYASAFGTGEEFTPQQRAAFSQWMDQIYANFLGRVAEGRDLPLQRVQQIARGHVWTGVQARDLGLVDQVGGFYEAVDRAKALAKISGEVKLKRVSAGATPVEFIEKLLGVEATSAKTLAAAAWVLGDPRAEAIIDQAAQARLREGGAMVLAPQRVH